MQAMEATTAPTKVIYGVNELDLDLAGKSIRGIWKVLEQVLNIPRDAAVSVNGDRVQDDYVVRPGDEIEFQKGWCSRLLRAGYRREVGSVRGRWRRADRCGAGA